MGRLDKVIYEVNGKDTFVKVKNGSFQIEKAIFSFVKYDPQTNKSLNSGDFYMDFENCMKLANDIERGILQRDMQKEIERMKAENAKYAKPVRQYQGGVTKEKAKRTDGNALARIMTIEPGLKSAYVIKYMEGAGKLDDKNKLITPIWWSDKNTKADFMILVPCSSEDMEKLLVMLKTHISSYITSCYMNGSYEKDFQENKPGNNGNANNYQKPQETQKPAQKPVQVPTNNSPGKKPHSVITPVATSAVTQQNAQNEEGETSDQRYMKVKFISAPTYIEGSNGLYNCKVDIQGKSLVLYFTDDTAKTYKQVIQQFVESAVEAQICYVIVKDEQKKAYTYFMGMGTN